MLPAPIDGTQEYLKAVHDRLGEILDRLPAKAPPSVAAGDVVELREPAAPESEPQAAQAGPVTPVALSGSDAVPRPARTPKPPASKRSTKTTKEA